MKTKGNKRPPPSHCTTGDILLSAPKIPLDNTSHPVVKDTSGLTGGV